MRLVGIVYLLYFYGLDVVPADMVFDPITFMKGLISPNRKRSSNAKFNPDVILNTLEMIRRAGYPAEAHVIMTEDGYLLTLHRIPGRNDSVPVLLQHGLLGSSADWVILGKGKALVYLLADQGYDVWLGNFRGNTYSRAHISLSPSNSTFWDFSFNELGIYDLPAMITFITNMRSQPLHTYIGHSMGTTTFYVMASERPEIARMVQMMISLAPTAFVSHMQSPIRFLVPFWKGLKRMVQFFFHGEFLPSDFVRLLAKYGCTHGFTKNICANIIFTIFGYDYKQFNYALEPVIVSHDPAGTSVKMIAHYVQALQTGKFRKYDYGHAKNLLIYHSVEPPSYKLANITVPIALLYSANDWLISIEDVRRLYHLLPNVVDMYEVSWPKFNHVDFLWAKDAPKLVYERVLKIMKRENLNITSNVT
ncbi:Lipase 3 [Camponotus floridanus]|uniref:Lipase n=1 Tax=Camponotus floridanus TaxID=104421 RepID=E2AHE1_CAMFO|nr:lipase 3 [Camponotus floridanus]EFN67149.1 Lipase 3 [Camponotus floridanus]